MALAALPPADGGDPTVRTRLLGEMRAAVEQYADASASAEMQAAFAAAPSPLIAPNHALVLLQMKRRVESLGRQSSDLAGRLSEVTGHVLLSTMPTGELNAQTVAVRGSGAYLILFDPVFFPVIDCFSAFFARAIDDQAALKAAYEYGQSGVETDLTQVMRGNDRGVVAECFLTLRSLLFSGVPPPRLAPRPEGNQPFAAFLRETAGLFVTAHEYGHVLLHHADTVGDDAKLSRVEKEFAADRVGCGIVMAYGEQVKSSRAERFIGTHFFMAAALLVETVRRTMETGTACRISDLARRREPGLQDTHPSTALRLGYVNEWLEHTYPPELYRGTQYYCALLINVAERLLDCVQPALLEEAKSGRKLTTSWYQARSSLEVKQDT